MTLFFGMTLVGAITLYFVHWDSIRRQEQALRDLTEEIAQASAAQGERLRAEPSLNRWIDDLARSYGLPDRPVMLIVDPYGRELQKFPPHPPVELRQLTTRWDRILTGESLLQELEPYQDRAPYLAAIEPVVVGGEVLRYVIYLTPQAQVLEGLLEFKLPRFIVIITLLLCGWVSIYLLTRRLLKPIRQAAAAAEQIVAGNYAVRLADEQEEKEVYELMRSFREMASRLQQLESLRTQLLAGVTHELKTPVTTISGVVQAVKEGVVTGREADEFLDVCLKESLRLQKLVEDLLEFNSFAAGAVVIGREGFDLSEAVEAIISRWQLGCAESHTILLERGDECTSWPFISDPHRLEQILINLLNNARDATDVDGTIIVRLSMADNIYRLEVQDSGHGIPEDEQPELFEPFFRGRQKKTRIRGMGLGLPFSRLIARSLGGELLLIKSSSEGTLFELRLPHHPT